MDPSNTVHGTADRRRQGAANNNEAHASVDQEVCLFCGTKFNNLEDLVTHTEAFHSQLEERPRLEPCPFCGQVFETESSLLSHVEMHGNSFSSPIYEKQSKLKSEHCVSS